MNTLDSIKEANQKAQELAQNKQLRAAVDTAETALNLWTEKSQIWEKLLGRFLIANIIDSLEKQLVEWRKQVAQADQLLSQAESILENEQNNPLETKSLTTVIALYHLYNQVIVDQQGSDLITKCQQELAKKQQYHLLIKKAKTQAENRFFKTAITIYQEAENLYSTDAVKQAITSIESQLYQEEKYDSILEEAKGLSDEGKFKTAISILDSVLTDFPRVDGFDLLKKLKSRLTGREIFAQGLVAEKRGDFSKAKSFYEQATPFLSNPTDAQIRLGLVEIKMQNWENSLSHLQNLLGQQAAYLRGFVFAQQGNLQSAYREWQEISHPLVIQQKEAIKNISQRERLLYLQKIESLVKAENFIEAEEISHEFLHKFVTHPVLESNLENYIKPNLEISNWQKLDLSNIAKKMKNEWVKNPHINTLHNWTVACYYYTQKDSQHLLDLIIALSTALANIKIDNSLKDIPWLKDKQVDFSELSINLKNRLETELEKAKNINLENYLKLRDYYRRESVSLQMMAESHTLAIKVNDLLITPGCHDSFSHQWQNLLIDNIHESNHIFRCLYTPWGLAVAACLEGDIQRAIDIKPTNKPTNPTEKFADNLLNYYQACYYLQQQKWRLAIIPLKSIQTELKNNQAWLEEIDRLCELQRQLIFEFSEHLEFATLRYEIYPQSKYVKSYFGEYKAEEIRQQLVNDKISLIQALRKLQELQKIDDKNSVVNEMIENVEVSQELKEINRLFQVRQYEAMLNKAKLSKRKRVRYLVAEFFINKLVQGIQEGHLQDQELILQLGSWAYEICPHEPAFQDVYRSLKLC